MKPPATRLVAAALCSLILALTGPARAETVGSGKVISETRQISNFHGVELTGTGDLIITQGESEGLVIEAEDNLLPLLESRIKDGTLIIGFKAHEWVEPTKPIIFKLAVKNLDELTLSGSGNVHAGRWSAPTAAIHLGGSGNIAIDELVTDTLTTELAGSGTISLSGSANEQTTEIAGSGEYQAGQLRSEAATVTIDGSGDCTLSATKTLHVAVNGSGAVNYYGSPTVVQHISGSGKVRAKTP